jgi:hypothetical protein
VFVGVSAIVAGAGAISVPAGVKQGDLLVYVGINENVGNSTSAVMPSGAGNWITTSLGANGGVAGTGALTLQHRFASASEPASWTPTGGVNAFAGFIIAYRNAAIHQCAPGANQPNNQVWFGVGRPLTPPAVTTFTDANLVVVIIAGGGSVAWTISTNVNSPTIRLGTSAALAMVSDYSTASRAAQTMDQYTSAGTAEGVVTMALGQLI